MALRPSNSSRTDTSAQKDAIPSLLPGLPLFFPHADKPPAMEWERWIDLFAVAVMAIFSISIDELTRTVDESHPRVKALIGDIPEEAAGKKVVTWLFLSVGEPARKLFKYKYPELSVWTLQTCCKDVRIAFT